jgi:hypothetical protein
MDQTRIVCYALLARSHCPLSLKAPLLRQLRGATEWRAAPIYADGFVG